LQDSQQRTQGAPRANCAAGPAKEFRSQFSVTLPGLTRQGLLGLCMEVVRCERQRAVSGPFGFLVSAGPHEVRGELAEVVGRARIEAGCLLLVADRLVELSLPPLEHADEADCFGCRAPARKLKLAQSLLVIAPAQIMVEPQRQVPVRQIRLKPKRF